MKYKAFLFDCDGTLTDLKDWKVVKSAAIALNKLQELGYIVVLATGRPAFFIPSVTEAGITPDYIVSSNGHVVTDKNIQTIWSVHFDEDLFNRVNEFCIKHNLGLFWKYEHGNRPIVYHPNMKMIFNQVPPQYVLKEVEAGILPNSGALVGEQKDRELFMSEFEGLLECVDGGLLLFDINKLGVSKKNGIVELMKILNISAEEVMAFGDSENDIEMLDYAGTSVVMESGMEIAKQHADYITDAPENDGILKALQHFGILD